MAWDGWDHWRGLRAFRQRAECLQKYEPRSSSAIMLEIAIIGAGPYGLSIAAHVRRLGVSFRVFGRPMDSWLAHMPKGMMLKSDGFASNLDDPGNEYTLGQFCKERGIEYADSGAPVHLD